MFQRGRSIREAYDDHFLGPGNGREVTFHRVVNIVERPMMGGDFDRRGLDGPMYNEPMPFQNPRDCQGNRNFPPNEMQYFDIDDHRGGNFRRNPPPQRNDGPPSHFMRNRDDLRHHLDSRNNGRGGNFYRNRGRDSGREDIDYRRREPFPFRDRSPIRRGNHSSSSGSRPAEKKVPCQQKPKPAAPASPPPSESPAEEPPPTTTTSKESPPASVAEPEEEAEAASVEPEPEPTPELDLNGRRVEAIKAKALEIEKDYRQDCETFRTVVKMLVEKEPSLDYLLQAPLEKNLEEMKGRCLDSLKQFIKELDEAIEPSATDQPTEGET